MLVNSIISKLDHYYNFNLEFEWAERKARLESELCIRGDLQLAEVVIGAVLTTVFNVRESLD